LKSISLAIDFGTTNSVIARWDDQLQVAQLINLPNISQKMPPPLVPSLVYVQDGKNAEILLGQPAKEMLAASPQDQRIFRDFKRGLLTADEAVARDIDGTCWNHADAGKYFVHKLLQQLPFNQSEIDQLVLTVPVTAFSHYLSWLTDTFSELQVAKVRVVDESTAAALGYAITEPGALVLVFDFGGGSLDLSLVRLPQSRSRVGGFLGQIFGVGAGKHAARVIAKSGQVLGGGDVDRWLLAEVLNQIEISQEGSGQENIGLLSACETAKIQLSSQTSTEILVQNGSQTQTVPITRTELEFLLHQHQFPERLQQAIQKILNTARREGIFREDIQNVLLVGGMSQMPLVQETLAAFFPDHTLHCDKPFTAVVEGALQIAAGFGLEDYLAHSYGLRHFDHQKGAPIYEEILPAGTRYPMDHPVEILLGSAHEGQQTIELIIGEIDSEAVSAVDVQYDEQGEAVFVAHLDEQNQAIHPINQSNAAENQIQLDAPPSPGEACLRAAFSLDANRQLFVTVTDLNSEKKLLEHTLLANLESTSSPDPIEVTMGLEPVLISETPKRIGVRLSIRQLANLLSANALPPDAYSIESAAVMLNHKDLYVRYEAARMLGRRGDRPARLVLEEALNSRQAPTRASAIRHVSGLTWFTAQSLLQKALADPEWRVRESAIFALCDFRDPRAYQLAAQALQQETVDEVFAAAAWGLRNSYEPEAVPALKASLQAQNLEIRERALESLGNNGSQEAAQVIHQVLTLEAEPDIRYAAALSLLEINGERALPDLITMIKNESAEARLAMLRAIFHASNYLGIQLGNSKHAKNLLAVLEMALNDSDSEVRLAVIWILAWMRHSKAEELLISACQAEENQPFNHEIRHIATSLGSPIAELLNMKKE
jgi:molecular chaperone DnaK (HSP70)/HEAT repeat protein